MPVLKDAAIVQKRPEVQWEYWGTLPYADLRSRAGVLASKPHRISGCRSSFAIPDLSCTQSGAPIEVFSQRSCWGSKVVKAVQGHQPSLRLTTMSASRLSCGPEGPGRRRRPRSVRGSDPRHTLAPPPRPVEAISQLEVEPIRGSTTCGPERVRPFGEPHQFGGYSRAMASSRQAHRMSSLEFYAWLSRNRRDERDARPQMPALVSAF